MTNDYKELFKTAYNNMLLINSVDNIYNLNIVNTLILDGKVNETKINKKEYNTTL